MLEQTQARVFDGERHYSDKIVSIFEEHTAVIRKGKASKPTEFGRLVRIDEVENGIVSNYNVADGNPADQPQWMPALDEHTELFAQPPEMATADRGFFSAVNERQAKNSVSKELRCQLQSARTSGSSCNNSAGFAEHSNGAPASSPGSPLSSIALL
mgnify:CR=1 FL=1